ncbi:hypothetical protein [Leucobacter chinensis]|uniref:hypothetical protein n=1 Tax=Leucobacter chinensis TaxID=2851010 RepID=UPI001C241B5E|nr:hypothetical protein [Leucobacter chinensis]
MAPRTFTRIMRDDSGAAGKVLLIVAAFLVLLAVAVLALWRPVIQPLIGDGLATRVEGDTDYLVPRDDAQLSLTLADGWVVQRSLYQPEQALLKSPDFSVEVLVSTWMHGASPSAKTALAEAIEGWHDHTETRIEAVSDDVVAVSVFGHEKKRQPEKLVVALAKGSDERAKAFATLTVSTKDRDLDEVLPAVAELIATAKAVER